MNETMVTLQGYVGGNVRIRAAGDSEVATFRVACTPRRYSRKDDTWSDAPTQWFTVSCWRGLAGNIDRSLRRGDPVIVHGRLNLRTWVSATGAEMTDFEVDAQLVGHDLNRGTTAFAKAVRPAAAPTSESGAVPTDVPAAVPSEAPAAAA